MKHFKLYLIPILLSAILFSNCSDDDGTFGNKLSMATPSKVNTILIKPAIIDDERIIQVMLARPENHDITITYKAAPELLDTYNAAYYDNAKILPAMHYSLSETSVTMPAGSQTSTGIKVLFKNINQLNRDSVYVLPITIDKANIGILQSARTTYYVFRGAALINVVADIDENYLHIDTWANAAPVSGLTVITLEALIRVRNYDRMISTVMGIEGRFLIRLGDANFPANQIQVATTSGNFPPSDASKGLPTNEWTHIAVTYDRNNYELKIYVNGVVQSETTMNISPINLGINGVDGFYIGRSYADERYLAGEISECRIWNIARTQEEIANNFYEVDPESPGLVAYWKCDDGGGNQVKDHTTNANHLMAKTGSVLKWTSVSLPAMNN